MKNRITIILLLILLIAPAASAALTEAQLNDLAMEAHLLFRQANQQAQQGSLQAEQLYDKAILTREALEWLGNGHRAMLIRQWPNKHAGQRRCVLGDKHQPFCQQMLLSPRGAASVSPEWHQSRASTMSVKLCSRSKPPALARTE